MKCKNCKKIYKSLTKEGLCACCYMTINKEWSKDFSDQGKKKN